MAESCKIIHVNNPPLDIEGEEEINRKKRGMSRIALLEHLKDCQDIYRPQKLQ